MVCATCTVKLTGEESDFEILDSNVEIDTLPLALFYAKKIEAEMNAEREVKHGQIF